MSNFATKNKKSKNFKQEPIMNEQGPLFDPLAEAQARADVGRQIYENYMERGLDPTMSVQDQARGHADLASYLEARPVEPVTESTHYDDTLVDGDYSKMHNSILVKKWAEAEDAGDKTIVGDIHDEIIRRVTNRSDRESAEDKAAVFDQFISKKDALRKNKDKDTKDDTHNENDDEKKQPEDKDGKYGLKGDQITQDDSSIKETVDDNLDIAKDPLKNGVKGGDEDEDPTIVDGRTNEGKEIELWKGIEEVPLPEGLQGRLNQARNEFVRLTAQRRGKIFGGKKALAEAKRAYEDARNEAGAYVALQLELQNATPEQIREFSILGTAAELFAVTGEIYTVQMAGVESKRFKGFYDWWARQGGRKENGKFNFAGMAKKGAAMFAIGLLPGAAIGVAAGAVLSGGAALGAIVGGAAARGVARGLMGAKVSKEASASTVAADQLTAQHQTDGERLGNRIVNGDSLTTEDVTEGIQDRTDHEVGRNQRRVGAAAILGAVGGAAGAYVGGLLHGTLFGGGGGRHPSARGPGKPHTPKAAPTPPAAPNSPKPPIDLGPATDRNLPWTHVTDRIGHNGTPDIFEAVRKGHEMGIDIVGKGRGLESVTFNGVTYTDNAHINAALDYIMNQQNIA